MTTSDLVRQETGVTDQDVYFSWLALRQELGREPEVCEVIGLCTRVALLK